MCEDRSGDGWEEEISGDEREFTRGGNCSEAFDEWMEAAGENLVGVPTGIVVSAETTGTTPLFGVALA